MADYTKLDIVFSRAVELCQQYRHEFVMPEHVLLALFEQEEFASALLDVDCDPNEMRKQLVAWLMTLETVPSDSFYRPEGSQQFTEMIESAYRQAKSADVDKPDISHLVNAMMMLPDSMAAFILLDNLGEWKAEFISDLVTEFENSEYDFDDDGEEAGQEQGEAWRRYVTCINDDIENHNPLIGRHEELERTIQVLCRKDKNNPLHVGEPGVGKTALVYGLASMIERGEVPERLKGSLIFSMDMGSMLAGTQYRGDFEKRIKQVMDGISKLGNAIVYIDEIHNIIGAGRTDGGPMDASNMLKPYLESGKVRFIGSTTYDEYNKYVAQSRGIVRRFQQIDIAEPSIEETLKIVEGLKGKYEEFHGVTYESEAIDFAVRATAKHISDRFLPDKAIDLIDESGAYLETHPDKSGKHVVGRKIMAGILAKMCKIEAEAMKEDDNLRLATLEKEMKERIFGQDEAIRQVVEAIQMSKAGLSEEDKPLASLLFVGPTGVGKTEVARTLSDRLGTSLLRFDMSEYAEKHAVAKLIGSPAGYVGYEDGGLLTAAISKNPNCVLLLDEIEKAHPDIYNILLQVMDYARLTDNKGRKADFRNVVLIMTSNAGAQFASQAQVGFRGGVSRGEAMMAQVKRTFKPEFLNRLSATVAFNDMDRGMASLILDKKLHQLQGKLTAKGVTMLLSDEARELLLQNGFTQEYGAREMDRAIARLLKPLLMKQILFGNLRNGGTAEIIVKDGKITIG